MAKLLEEDYEQIHMELEEEKRSKIKIKKEYEEAISKVNKELDSKELELIQRNAELAESKERLSEMSEEIKQNKKAI